jgi:hypothetical protein
MLDRATRKLRLNRPRTLTFTLRSETMQPNGQSLLPVTEPQPPHLRKPTIANIPPKKAIHPATASRSAARPSRA